MMTTLRGTTDNASRMDAVHMTNEARIKVGSSQSTCNAYSKPRINRNRELIDAKTDALQMSAEQVANEIRTSSNR